LKTFRGHFLANDKVRELFRAEVATWIALEKHPNIVRCFSLEQLDSRPFMVLEWVTGEEGRGTDLRGWLRRGRLASRPALGFVIDICRGLAYAQIKQPGIVHRDLKPDNVLINQNAIAKITDFGLAKTVGMDEFTASADGRMILRAASGPVGTPPYMAPEQWDPLAEVDIRADLYAVGCILFQLLTGRWPFNAATSEGFRRLHTTAPTPDLELPEAPPALSALVRRCLAKQKEDRFDTPGELLKELASIYQECFREPPRPIGQEETFTAIDYVNRGAAFNRMGFHDRAIADYSEAIRLDPNYPLAYTNRGNAKMFVGRFDEALADQETAVRLDSGMALAHHNRGSALFRLDRLEEALAAVDLAIALDPQVAVYHCTRGGLYVQFGRIDEGLTDLDQAVRLDPNFAGTYLNRAGGYIKLRRWEDALADLNGALELDPHYVKALVSRGEVLTARNRFDEALRDFDLAIRLNTSNRALALDLYYNRSRLYSRMGKRQEQLDDLSRILILDTSNAEMHYERGLVYTALHRYPEALADYDWAVQLGPPIPAWHLNRGVTLIRLGRSEEAIPDLTRALELDPTYARAYANRGAVYADKPERVTEALADFARAIKLDPSSADSFINRANLQSQLGHHEAAVADYGRAIDLQPDNAQLWFARGFSLLKLERGAEAAPDLARATELDPHLVDAHVLNGNNYFFLGRFAEGAAALDRAHELGVRDAKLYYFRGACRQYLGRTDEAVADYQQALELEPDNDAFQFRLGALLANLGRLAEGLSYLKKSGRAGNPQALERAAEVREALIISQLQDQQQLLAGVEELCAAPTVAHLREVVDRFPFLTEPSILASLVKVLDRFPDKLQRRVEPRIGWLQQIANNQPEAS
jgi:tetratricopeptide (TPR) repeat protein